MSAIPNLSKLALIKTEPTGGSNESTEETGLAKYYVKRGEYTIPTARHPRFQDGVWVGKEYHGHGDPVARFMIESYLKGCAELADDLPLKFYKLSTDGSMEFHMMGPYSPPAVDANKIPYTAESDPWPSEVDDNMPRMPGVEFRSFRMFTGDDTLVHFTKHRRPPPPIGLNLLGAA